MLKMVLMVTFELVLTANEINLRFIPNRMLTSDIVYHI